MPVDIDSPEAHVIRKMVPFSTMPNSIFKVICDKLTLENARSGTFLFKRGDTNDDLFYLLKGEVSLEYDKLKIEVIKADTESARFALAHQIPRKINAVAKGSVRFLRLNSIFIKTPEKPSVSAQADKQSVDQANVSAAHDWIATLLMVPIIRALPPANVQKISAVLDEVRFQKNDLIIKQGEFGEHFFIIKEGECLVSHKNSPHGSDVKVAKLQTWDIFGEAALISGEPRGETVSALTDVVLLRISKANFLTLIKEPSLKFVDYEELSLILDRGGILLDVRSPDEYENLHLENAVNAPLFSLRTYLKSLDKEKAIVVSCDDGRLSESAAFLLLTYNFSVKILAGGIQKAPWEALRRAKSATIGTKVHEDVIFDKAKPLVPSGGIVTRDSFKPDQVIKEENLKLKRQLQELKTRCEKAEQEKFDLEARYKVLLKQSERLKAMLETLTK